MSIEIQNIEGKSSGKKVTLNKDIFAVEPNDHAIYLDVKWYLARRRQGTSKAKERAEVTGSTRKIKKQKGTGTARAGSIKSPVFVGGGRAFGPEPRDYGFKLNKKVKRLARMSALSLKAQNKNVRVLEDLSMDAPKTKEFVSLIKNLELVGNKALFVTEDVNSNVVLSARNISKAKVVTAANLNTYDIMNANVLVVCEGALGKINEVLSK